MLRDILGLGAIVQATVAAAVEQPPRGYSFCGYGQASSSAYDCLRRSFGCVCDAFGVFAVCRVNGSGRCDGCGVLEFESGMHLADVVMRWSLWDFPDSDLAHSSIAANGMLCFSQVVHGSCCRSTEVEGSSPGLPDT